MAGPLRSAPVCDAPEPPVTVALVRKAAVGDEEAFTGLFERHFQRVLRMTALRLGHLLRERRDEVEDAVHEAFADVFQRIRGGGITGLDTDGSFRRYIGRAASNAVLQGHREQRAAKRGGGRVRRQRDLVAADDSTLFGWVRSPDPGPSTVAYQADLEERLERAVLALDEPYRTAIELRAFADMSYAEIAASGELAYPSGDVLTSPQAIRMVVLRARERLRTAVPELAG